MTDDNSAIANFTPRLRPVEIFPLEVDGQQAVGVRDPMQAVDETMLMTPLAGLIVSLFDGNHTIGQIAGIIREHISQEVPHQEIMALAQNLDDRHFMATENFENYYQELLENFRAADRRPAYHAGKGYPDDAGELRELLLSFFSAEGGPGLPSPPEGERSPISGLVAPHLDLRQGGVGFAHAYHALAQAAPPDLFVILGTGHAGSEGMFVASKKTFETPLGDVEADGDFLSRLDANFGGDLYADEILHRAEHVIEFQLLFLQLLYGGADGRPAHPFKIAPILCTYAPVMTQCEMAPEHAGAIEAFGKALKDTIRKTAGRVCVVSSIDLAHVGPRYGDRQPPTPDELRQLEQDDRRTMELVAAGDADTFNENMLADRDRRRICGYPCLHTMLHAGEFRDGELLCYDQAQVDTEGSVVSHSSMIFR